VASVSSCHMLTFVYLASRQGFQVDSYVDEAVGLVTKNENGVPWVSSIRLKPQISYGGEKLPTREMKRNSIIWRMSNASLRTR